ncbi:MAG: pyrroloquinoline quinone-dependent dehydrogenase [Gemmatimonadales bacterium]
MPRPAVSLCITLIAASLACEATPRSTEGPPGAAAAEWPAYGGSPDGAHFAALGDITRDNVRTLRVAWTYRTGDVSDGSGGRPGTNFEATPIMLDGTLYTSTPFGRVVALDAETGAERWTFDPHVNKGIATHDALTSRGVASWLDGTRADTAACRRRIFVATFDARLIALDARTGAPCADFGTNGEVDLHAGVKNVAIDPTDYHMSSAPTVARGVVVVGSAISDNRRVDAPNGVVRGFDARTGSLRWSWDPIAAAGPQVRAGAGNAWAPLTADEERGLVFVPTGSASPDHFGSARPGPNRDANSIVVLHAETGVVAWRFQLVHHDLWDYDVSSPPALFTLTRDGRPIPAVAQGSKMGSLFIFNRETGEPLFPIEERPVPASDVAGEDASPTQPVPLRPRPLAPQGLTPGDAWGVTFIDRGACRRRMASLRSEGIFTPPALRGTIEYPGFIGGMNWGGVAVDAARGVLVANTNRLAGVVTLIPRDSPEAKAKNREWTALVYAADSTPYVIKRELLRSPLGAPCNPPPWSALSAVDVATGDVKWEVPLGTLRDLTWIPTPSKWGSPTLGGPLATAGGLVFIAAAMDHTLRAFDIETGRDLWHASLPASAQATPMSYRARTGGKQFIVIAAGGHQEMRSKLGDYIVAFALP